MINEISFECITRVITKKDRVLLSDGDKALHQTLPNSRARLRGNLAGVSPALGLVITFDFLGE